MWAHRESLTSTVSGSESPLQVDNTNTSDPQEYIIYHFLFISYRQLPQRMQILEGMSISDLSCPLGLRFIVVKSHSCVRFFCNPMDCSPSGSSVHGASRQEYRGGFSFPFPGDLSGSRIKPMSPPLAGGFFTSEPPGKLLKQYSNLLG